MSATDRPSRAPRVRAALLLLLGTAAFAALSQTLAQTPAPAPATTWRPSAIPSPLPSASIDLGALAAELQRKASPAALPGPEHRLYVFVSLGMPAESMKRLMRQAAQADATVVLRGLHEGSMQQTVKAWASLQSDAGATTGLQIDPEAFDRYGVTAVPTFVVARVPSEPGTCAGERCAAASDFVKVAGDVSLGYALRHMMQLPSAPVQRLRQLGQRVPE